MKNKFYIILLTILSLNCNYSVASLPVDGLVSKCLSTPNINNLKYEPEEFNTTNNLRQSTGSFLIAEGQRITIWGRIMDKNCVPVSDAKIEVWQANTYGLYQYGEQKSKNNDNRDKVLFDKNFVGSGTIYSDNMGRFKILSIKPGSFKNNAPHINIRVTSKELGNFETKMYFSDSIDNLSDKTFKNLKPNHQSRLLATNLSLDINDENIMKDYTFDIVLPEELKSKSY